MFFVNFVFEGLGILFLEIQVVIEMVVIEVNEKGFIGSSNIFYVLGCLKELIGNKVVVVNIVLV